MKDVIEFLKLLQDNNDRTWFEANKKTYLGAKSSFEKAVNEIEIELGKSDLIDKSKIFRIYRDVRFSADKSPYKNNFGVSFSRATKERRGGYYLHIQPGQSFVGGGFWQPQPEDLKRVRDEIAADPESIKKIIEAPAFKKAFTGLGTDDKLSRPPKGYDKDLPGIEFIKLKSFVAMRPLTDAEIISPDFVGTVIQTFHTLRPFFNYMSGVLTTNLNGESLLE